MDANHCCQCFNMLLSISVSLPGHHLLPSTWSSWTSLYRTSWLLTPSAGIKACASMPSCHFWNGMLRPCVSHLLNTSADWARTKKNRLMNLFSSLFSSPLLPLLPIPSPPPSPSTQNPISWDKRLSNWYPSPANGGKLRKRQTPWDPLG